EQRRRLVPGDEAGVCRTAGAVGGEEFTAKRRAGVRGVPRLERAQDEMRTEVRDVDLAIAETGGVEVEESDRRIGHQYLLVVEVAMDEGATLRVRRLRALQGVQRRLEVGHEIA